MRTLSRTSTLLTTLAVLITAGWLIGMYAGNQTHASATGNESGMVIQARADFPPDAGTTRPGPTDPNGPAH
jgi:hypothetical protein